jgi:DNA-binding transcriptional LysR family regulator
MKSFTEVQSLRIFIAIVDANGLAAAARVLGQTSSALSQRLRQLEDQLGVKLLHRSTRKLQLTDEGNVLYERGRSLIGGLDELQRELVERRDALAGPLSLFAPLGFGREHLASLVAEFHALHPGLNVSLTLSDRLSAHPNERFDLVVHIGEAQISSSAAYRIAPNARFLCASPSYLKNAPPLNHPDDLVHHRCLILRDNDEDVTLWQLSKGEAIARVRVTPTLCSNDGDVIKRWALDGKGLVVRSEWSVAKNIERGELVRVLPDWISPDADVVAIVPHRDGMPVRVRSFLDFLRGRFRPYPIWRVPAPPLSEPSQDAVSSIC